MTESEAAVLRALGLYRYLTAKQIYRLQIVQHPRTVYALLTSLADKRSKEQREPTKNSLIWYTEYGRGVGGRIDQVWWLTPLGAQKVRTEPNAKVLAKNDRVHALNVIDFHISVRQWAHAHHQHVAFFHPYFGYSNYVSVQEASARPDAVFGFVSPERMSRLFVFEMYDDPDTSRPYKQLRTYVPLLEQEAFEEAYKCEDNLVRVLCSFDKASVERNTRARLKLGELASQFFFTTGTGMDDWRDVAGEPVDLF